MLLNRKKMKSLKLSKLLVTSESKLALALAALLGFSLPISVFVNESLFSAYSKDELIEIFLFQTMVCMLLYLITLLLLNLLSAIGITFIGINRLFIVTICSLVFGQFYFSDVNLLLNGIPIQDQLRYHHFLSDVFAFLAIYMFWRVLKFKRVERFLKYIISYLKLFSLVSTLLISISFSFNLFDSSDLIKSRNLSSSPFQFGTSGDILVLVLDTHSGIAFNSMIVNDSTISRAFSGFTSYTNAMGSFPTTKGATTSIAIGAVPPSLLAYESIIEIAKTDGIFEEMRKRYELDVSTIPTGGREYGLVGTEALRASSIRLDRPLVRAIKNFEEITFKSVPYTFKPVIYDFEQGRISQSLSTWLYSDDTSGHGLDVKLIKSMENEIKVDARVNPTLHFYHLWGAHPPAPNLLASEISQVMSDYPALDESNLDSISTAKLIYILDLLKQNAIYDELEILVISDHGPIYVSDSLPEVFGENLSTNANILFLYKEPGAKKPLSFSSTPMHITDVSCLVSKGLFSSMCTTNEEGLFVSKRNRDIRVFSYYNWDDSWSAEYLPKTKEFFHKSNSDPEDSTISNFEVDGKLLVDKLNSVMSSEEVGWRVANASGFSSPESWGIWSHGIQSQIEILRKSEAIVTPKTIKLGIGKVPISDFYLNIFLNGISVFETFNLNSSLLSNNQIQIEVPRNLSSSRNLVLTFWTPHPWHSKSLGIDLLDERVLAFPLSSIHID